MRLCVIWAKFLCAPVQPLALNCTSLPYLTLSTEPKTLHRFFLYSCTGFFYYYLSTPAKEQWWLIRHGGRECPSSNLFVACRNSISVNSNSGSIDSVMHTYYFFPLITFFLFFLTSLWIFLPNFLLTTHNLYCTLFLSLKRSHMIESKRRQI